jgi:hypothetical protein
MMVSDIMKSDGMCDTCYSFDPAPVPQGEPDGKLHVDGYFTWTRREGYVVDKRLPCGFYLAPQRVTQPLSDARLDGLIETHAGCTELTDDEYASVFAFARAIEAAHGIGEQP